MAYPLEIILHRQLAECQAIPVFIVDPAGNLLFYNEAAEELLGRRFEDTGEMPVELLTNCRLSKPCRTTSRITVRSASRACPASIGPSP